MKRILSVILAVLLVFSSLPITVIAGEDSSVNLLADATYANGKVSWTTDYDAVKREGNAESWGASYRDNKKDSVNGGYSWTFGLGDGRVGGNTKNATDPDASPWPLYNFDEYKDVYAYIYIKADRLIVGETYEFSYYYQNDYIIEIVSIKTESGDTADFSAPTTEAGSKARSYKVSTTFTVPVSGNYTIKLKTNRSMCTSDCAWENVILSDLELKEVGEVVPDDAAVVVEATPSKMGVSVGETFTVDFNVTTNKGFCTLGLDVGYDPEVLEVVCPKHEDGLKCRGARLPVTNMLAESPDGADNSASCSPYHDTNPYKIYWAFGLAEEDVVATGRIATLTFKVKDAAAVSNTTITLNVDQASSLENGAYDITKLVGIDADISICTNHIYNDYRDEDCNVCGAVRKIETGTTGDCTWTLSDNVLIISGNGAMEDYSNHDMDMPDYELPDVEEEWGDDGFGTYKNPVPWWDYKENIVSVVIDNGVTNIGDEAFDYCYNLIDISIPNSVTTIGKSAFSNCARLTSITIPNSVKSIGSLAFSDCYSLKNVTIPGSVISMGEAVFAYCNNLANIIIAEGVTKINYSTFSSCTGLETITIPKSVTSIGDSAFFACSKLTKVYYSGTVNDKSAIAIGNRNDCLLGATWHYTGTTGECTWTLDGTVLTISGNGAMGDYYYTPCLGGCTCEEGHVCDGPPYIPWETDITEVIVEDGVTRIGDLSFWYCDSLISVSLPNSVTSIGYDAFVGCYDLTDVYYSGTVNDKSNIYIDEGNDSLLNATWHYTENDDILTGTTGDCTWTLSGTTLTISGDGAMGDYYYTPCLDGCPDWEEHECDGQPYIPWETDITEVIVEDGVTRIGDLSFWYCDSLISVSLPNSVTSIGYDAFVGCYDLTDVYYGGTLNDKSNISIAKGNNYLLNATWHYTGCITHTFGDWKVRTEPTCTKNGEEYRTCSVCGAEETNVISKVEHNMITEYVCESVCIYPGDLWDPDLDDELIDPDDFDYIPGTEIYEHTTYDKRYCTNCDFVEYENEVESSLYIAWDREPTCTESGWGFEICSYCGRTINDEYWESPLGHTYDDDFDTVCNVCGDVRVLTGRTGDCTWTLDGTVLTISGNGAMGDYSYNAPWGTKITKVIIEDGVTSIGYSAFSNCTSLTSITIPDSVTSVGDDAFRYCYSLTSITIPDSVTSIGDYAFSNCTSLTSVSLGDSVTSIGECTFSDCSRLTSIRLPDSVTSIGVDAFSYCDNLTSITIPESVTSIGDYAFYDCSKLKNVYYRGNEEDKSKIFIWSYNGNLTSATWHYNCCIGSANHTYNNDCDDTCDLCGYERTDVTHKIKFNTPNYTFTNDSHNPFVLNNGVYNSTNKSINSTATFTLTAVNDGELRIEYYTSTEQNYDKLYILHNSTTLATVSGSTSWDTLILNVVAGDKIYLKYSKDGSVDNGNDEVYFKISSEWYDSTDNIEATCTEAVVCDICGQIVKETSGHVYDDDCDSVCNVCGNTRVVTGITGDCTWTLDGTVLTISGNGAMEDYRRYIGDDVYYYYTIPWSQEITKVVIENGVTCIGNYSFVDCEKLTSITIPNTVTTINYRAFYGCSKLTSITLPKSVTCIDWEAFGYCAVDVVYYIGSEEDKEEISISFENESLTSAIWYYNSCIDSANHTYDYDLDAVCNICGKVRVITGTTGECTWELDGTVLTISGNGAMDDYGYIDCWCQEPDSMQIDHDCWITIAPWGTDITEVIVEEGVTHIGEYAFENCDRLESVSLPTTVTFIGYEAFAGCCNLTNLYYRGTTLNIRIDSGNGYLYNATWHFNSCIGAKDHTYTNVCDTTCNVCGELRTVPHYYDNDCDTTCNKCGGVRDNISHKFENSNDLVCDICGFVRYISYSTYNNQVTITDCDPSLSGIITIPATIKGKPVTAIDNNAFYECAYITGIILPDGLLTIGNNAFAYCTSLTGMNIPASVISIANNAFAHSTMFAEIVVNSNNDTYSSVDGVLFNKTQTTLFIYPAGKADKEYIIPDTVTVISENAFLKCGNLTSVVVPNGVTTLAKQTFYYCQNLVNVVLSENLTSIGDSVFYYCRSLKNIVVPSKVTSIESMAFFYCSALSSVTLPKNIQTISSNAFGNCPFLKNVYYLGSESEAAQISINSNNASLLSATWHYNSCVGSAVHTFDDCYDTVCNLCTATRQVTHDYDNACDTTCNVCGLVRQVPNHVYDNLCDTTCNVCGATRTVPHYYDNACDSTCNVCGITREVPNHFYDSDYDSICNVCGVIRTVTGKTGQCDWSLTGTVLTLSGNGIMADYDSADEVPWGHEITEVIISSGVVYIGKNAFTNSTELTSITIPDTVEYVSGSAFKNTGYYNNPSNWENKVLYLGKYLIKAEASISGNYTVKDGTVSIAKSAFSGCNELTGISMSDSVKFLGSGTFYYCQKLTSVELSSELKSINKNTFYCCSSLESIVIPSNVAEIGDMAFFYCSKLSFVTLPKDVSVIGSTAFASCPQLRTVYYRGSESDAENISINSNNTSILSATWYYNSCIGSEMHTFDDCYDTLCDICAETREVSHVYDNVCDDKCNECGDLRDVPDHVYGDWIIDVNATCETAGAKHRECIHCGEIENAVISALNHEYNVVVTNPDCENQGYTTYSCVRCNYSYKADYTPPTGHTEVIDEAVPPTCTEKGLTEGKHCSVCNKVLVAQTEVDKLGHNYNAVVTNPTPEEQGYTTYTCTRCGDSYVDDYLPALGYDGEITFTNVVTGKGKIIRIKASVKDNPGINTFTFNVKYDQSVLTLNEVIVDESIGGNVFVNKNILWWSPEDVVFNGEFVELVFTVNENAELGDTSVTFEYTSGNVSNSNEDVINFKIASSTVSVVEYLAGDINGDGMLTGQDLTRLHKYLAEIEGIVVNQPALDINNDGYVNAKDLTRLMRYLSGEEIGIY